VHKPGMPEMKRTTEVDMTQLDRIENKLDTLLELMAAILETEEQEEVQLDLDGAVIPGKDGDEQFL
jgi:hypothetical protein